MLSDQNFINIGPGKAEQWSKKVQVMSYEYELQNQTTTHCRNKGWKLAHFGCSASLQSRIIKNPDARTGSLARPFAHLLAPLARSFAPHGSLCSLPCLWDTGQWIIGWLLFLVFFCCFGPKCALHSVLVSPHDFILYKIPWFLHHICIISLRNNCFVLTSLIQIQ